ncbi:MAG: leucine--tRNA ligase [Oscillospiraceae bacterium]|jgi:leucyl-tRNA synthetase|nr:leucine--tRNA ligase [Oscillospiraceae bacterium]
MKEYDPKVIEPKWQDAWEKAGVFETREDAAKPKYYVLVEFPYPSGKGLHVGHTRPYTAMDALARARRMRGSNVLFPIGWDAFGLPAENYAIKNKAHPRQFTQANIAAFRAQIRSLGYSFDHSREVDTTDPAYYKWTQWIFLKMFERGLAYKADMPVNWCPSCKCVLANEEAPGGVCERCGAETSRREKSQWMLRITAYAERLLNDLDTVDYPARVKQAQKNWLGRSEGAEVNFAVWAEGRHVHTLRVFTTRPDTLYGATYMVLAPEHPLAAEYACPETEEYRRRAAKKTDFERGQLQKEKTGVALKGVTAVNPATGGHIPIYISDYVLMGYGTGAIMAVPGHDGRDWEFARLFGLPIVEVVSGGNVDEGAYTDTENGTLVNSGFLNGLPVPDAGEAMTRYLEEKGLGKRSVQYKLRDWVFARQRYWGEPIPIVHCPSCGLVPLPESELPLTLPPVESYEPTDTGESPLSLMESWVAVSCPRCGERARRETDTMPQWAGSSWYYLRYADPRNENALASREALDYWTPVDRYNGGMEHTTLHLLYSRFWHKFLYDIGVARQPEPYRKRTSHGDIIGPDGFRMSKSRGNIIDPMEVANEYGADAMRLTILFIGDFEKSVIWSPNAVTGCRRFLERVWHMAASAQPGDALSERTERAFHKAIKKVTEDIDALKFNTAIAALMTLLNEMAEGAYSRGDIRLFVTLLYPFAPHICEELWEHCGSGGLLAGQPWPAWREELTLDDTVEIAVQVGGKLRATVTAERGLPDEAVVDAALHNPRIEAIAAGRAPTRTVVVKNKLVNLIFPQ